jgi:hypothetical protein
MILSTTSSIIDALTIVTEETTDTVFVVYGLVWYGLGYGLGYGYGLVWIGIWTRI